MNNADMPAMPLENYQLLEEIHIEGEATERAYVKAHGLTKREHFAALAMQGLLANPGTTNVSDAQVTVVIAITDALLKGLEQ